MLINFTAQDIPIEFNVVFVPVCFYVGQLKNEKRRMCEEHKVNCSLKSHRKQKDVPFDRVQFVVFQLVDAKVSNFVIIFLRKLKIKKVTNSALYFLRCTLSVEPRALST